MAVTLCMHAYLDFHECEASEHIAKGCKRVLIASTPKSGSDIQIYVPGANDTKVDFNNDIILFLEQILESCTFLKLSYFLDK